LDTAAGILRELGRVYRSARAGELPMADATKLAFILGLMARIVEGAEFEARLDRLEARHEVDDTRTIGAP